MRKSRLARGATLLAALLMTGCQSVYFSVFNIGQPAPAAEGVVFDPAHELALDVYRPAGTAGGAPVVVFFHGGSWQSGRRAWYRFVGDALAARGALVIIPTTARGGFPTS